MRKFGYFLYSEHENNFVLESEYLKKLDCSPILYDKFSTADDSYESFDLLIQNARPGDLVLLRSIDNLATTEKQLQRNICVLHQKRIHLLVMEQVSFDTQKFGLNFVYDTINEFCLVNFEFLSDRALKTKKVWKSRYKGWTWEKVSLAEKCFALEQTGLKTKEIQKALNITYNLVRKYLSLCEAGEIEEIKKDIKAKEKIVKQPSGRRPGLSKVGKIKVRELQRLVSLNWKPTAIQDRLEISKGTYYRYRKMKSI
jgi:hypothetical protein